MTVFTCVYCRISRRIICRILDAEILRGSLALYDWTDGELNRRRIDALTDVRHRPLQKLVKGGLLRGVEIEVTLNGGQFAGDAGSLRSTTACGVDIAI